MGFSRRTQHLRPAGCRPTLSESRRARRWRFIAVVVLASVWSLPVPVAAQARDTGAVHVRILDGAGQPVAGALVRLRGPQAALSERTADDGRVRFPALVPGGYTASVEIEGIERTRHEGLLVTVGRRTLVDLTVLEVEETVLVRSAQTALDLAATSLGAIVDDDLVDLTPSGAGLWNSILDKVPGLVLSGVDVGGGNATQQQRVAAHGTPDGQNRFHLNGIDTADVRGGAAGMFPAIPAFTEVSVSTAAHDIAVQSPGVIVDMVSKSGSNDWHGSARLYYSDEGLAGDNLDQELIDAGVRKGNPNTLLADLDLQLGGPLVPERLWAFVDHWRFDEERLIVGLPPEDLDGRALRNFTANLDWQMGDGQRLSARYFFSHKDRLNAGAGPGWPAASAWIQDGGSHNGQLHWQGTWDETYADARVGYMDAAFGFFARAADSEEPHPEFRADLPFSFDFFTGDVSGRPSNIQNWQHRFQASANVSRAISGSRMAHELEAGAQWSEGRAWRLARAAFGVQTQWIAGGEPAFVDLTNTPRATLEDIGRDGATAEGIRAIGLYVQDSLSIGDRWNITAGLRLDISDTWLPAQRRPESWWAGLVPGGENADFFEAAEYPRQNLVTWADLVPRLSVAFDPGGDGDTLVRASYHQYSLQQNSADVGLFLNPNGGGGTQKYFWNDANGDGIFQWGEQGPLVSSFFPGPQFTLDPGLRAPRTHEITAGVERRAWGDLAVGARFIYRTVSDSINTINTGVPYGGIADRLGVDDPYTPVQITDPGPDGIVGTADDGGPITVFSQDPSTFGQDELLLTHPSDWGLDAGFHYRALELTARKRLTDRWQMLASWTLGRTSSDLGFHGRAGITASSVFTDPNADINRSGVTADDRTHIVKINGSYLLADPIGVNLGVSLRHETGVPFQRRIVVPRGTLEQGPVIVAAAPLGEDDTPGSLDGRVDSITLLDLRAEKQFALPGRWGRLTLTADVFNLLNESAPRSLGNFSGPNYGRVFDIVPPRLIRLGAGWAF